MCAHVGVSALSGCHAACRDAGHVWCVQTPKGRHHMPCRLGSIPSRQAHGRSPCVSLFQLTACVFHSSWKFALVKLNMPVLVFSWWPVEGRVLPQKWMEAGDVGCTVGAGFRWMISFLYSLQMHFAAFFYQNWSKGSLWLRNSNITTYA